MDRRIWWHSKIGLHLWEAKGERVDVFFSFGFFQSNIIAFVGGWVYFSIQPLIVYQTIRFQSLVNVGCSGRKSSWPFVKPVSFKCSFDHTNGVHLSLEKVTYNPQKGHSEQPGTRFFQFTTVRRKGLILGQTDSYFLDGTSALAKIMVMHPAMENSQKIWKDMEKYRKI